MLIFLLPYLNRITGADIPLSSLASYPAGLALLAIALVTGLLAGSYPAFYLSAFQVIKVIKGNFTSQVSASGIRRSLVVFQFVLSITLITGIVIIYSQLNFIKNKDLGFDQRQKLVFPFYTDESAEKIPAFANELRKQPRIDEVSQAAKAPGELLPFDMGLYKAGGNIASAVDASFQQADEHFLRATGIKLAAGRDFQRYDTGRIIINETLAKQLSISPGKSQGLILYTENNGNVAPLEIAGVMKDYNFSSLHENIRPQFLLYTPEGGRELIVSTNTKDYTQLLARLQKVWHEHFSDIPFQYRFVSDEVQKQYEAEAVFSNIITSFAGMAIFISCLGLFGLAAFNAEQRRKEISIRKVLGASVTGVAAILSKEFLKLIALSFIIAAPIAAWAMNQWLQGFAYRVPISWWMFAISGLLAIFIALATISFQAVKAALANPINSLREG
jgi:putative ABC transport system permease protein